MDELLDELNVSYQDLYKIHRGQNINEESGDSDQDSTTSSNSSLDHLKPPLYTYEEIQQNLIVIEAKSEESETCSSEAHSNVRDEIQIDTLRFAQKLPIDDAELSLRARASEVANRLSELITPTYCHICSKQSNGHYDYAIHYKKVSKWLKIELSLRNLLDVDLKLFFCEICNLVLSGNETAQYHYEESSHKENATVFCTVCLRRVTKLSMSEHLQTHRPNQKNENVPVSEPALTEIFISREGLPEDGIPDSQIDNIQLPVSDRSSNNKEDQQYSNSDNLNYVDALKVENKNTNTVNEGLEYPTNKVLERENKPAEVKDYRSLAQYILNLLSPSFCYICNVPALGHYKTQYHNRTFLKWIFNSKHMLELFGIEYVESLICFACRAVFFNSGYADSHYASEEHKRNISYFCNLCMVHDDNPKNHRDHNRVIIDEENLRKVLYGKTEKNNGKTVSDSDGHPNENNPTQHDPGKIVATKLILMLTPIFCYICQKCVNVHSFSNHYLERGHIIMLRKWLNVEIQKCGVIIDPSLIYCEACNLELCGTNLAVNHYQMAFHLHNQQTYCPICVVRGTPTAIFQHYYTWEHQYNYSETLRLLHKQNNVQTTLNIISQESTGNTSVPEALEKAITSSQCKLCGVMFHNKEEANIHYNSKSHGLYLNVWLEKNNMFGAETEIDSVTSQQYVENKLNNDNGGTAQKSLNAIKLEIKATSGSEIKCDENYLNPSCDKILGDDKIEIEPNKVPDKQSPDPNNEKYIKTKKLLSEQEIIETNINSLVPIIKLPAGKNTNMEEVELYKNVNDQVRKLLYKVYCLKAVPMEKSLLFLKKFNNELIEAEKLTLNSEYIDLFNTQHQPMTTNSVVNTLLAAKNKTSGHKEDSITLYLLQQKGLLEKIMKPKNDEDCCDSSSFNTGNVPVIKALDMHLNHVHHSINNFSWRCDIL